MKMPKFVVAPFHKRKSSSSSSSSSSCSPSNSSNSSPPCSALLLSSSPVGPFLSTETSGLSGQLVQELEAVFQQFDANRDGKISGVELGVMLRSLGDDASEEEIQCIVKAADFDGDGFINLQEFLDLNLRVPDGTRVGEESSTLGLEELQGAFSMFDADQKGLITAEKLHCVLVSLGDPCTMDDCRRMIRGWDRNGDGSVDFDEFKTMMMTAM